MHLLRIWDRYDILFVILKKDDTSFVILKKYDKGMTYTLQKYDKGMTYTLQKYDKEFKDFSIYIYNGEYKNICLSVL